MRDKNYLPHNHNNKYSSIISITNNKICCGCGACSVICNNSAIKFKYGQRFNFPEIDNNICISCKKCLKVCPSSFLLHGTEPDVKYEIITKDTLAYLIHSTDINIRREAASGGFITGLFVYLLENKIIDGCVVTRCEGSNALQAEAFIARDKCGVISATGSKYAPVSNCILIKDIIKMKGRYAFIGTPCMLEGLTKLEKYYPVLKEYIVLKVGFVCAGMSSRLSTRNYIEHHGQLSLKDVRKICYRGNGWPGRFRVFGDEGKLLMDRPLIGGSLKHVVGVDHYLRCQNCMDHWSHFADIVVSDPWSEEMIKFEKIGRSAIFIKNKRGRDAVIPAIKSGYFIADSISVEDMLNFNKHLVITENHPRHSWMALYQILFMHKFIYLIKMLKIICKGKVYGFITTLKSLFARKYYY